MNAVASSTLEGSRLTGELSNAESAVGHRGHLGLDQGATSSGDLPARYTHHVEAVLARIERAVVRALRELRDARDRRLTVRELRRLSPALLADIGIDPNDIEQVVDARLAWPRNLSAMRRQESLARRREARDGLR